MNTNLKTGSLLGVVAVVCVILGVALGGFFGEGNSLGGLVHNVQEEFSEGITVDNTEVISGSRGITATTGSFSGEVTLGNCGTTTWNPGSLASSSVDGIRATSTDIAVTGLALGDVCFASLDSSTSSAAVFTCASTGTATGTITLFNTGSTALDLATGTAKVCYFD